MLFDLKFEIFDLGSIELTLSEQSSFPLLQRDDRLVEPLDLIVFVVELFGEFAQFRFSLFEFLSSAREFGSLEVALFEQLRNVALFLL